MPNCDEGEVRDIEDEVDGAKLGQPRSERHSQRDACS